MSTTQNTSASSTPQWTGVIRAPPAPVTDPDPLRNLIVNYLPPLMNEAQLFQLFGQFGPVESVKIIYDRVTHESRGYGFVKFQFFFSATYAVSCLNRYEIAGKTLKVAYADAEQAKGALETMRETAKGFTAQQRVALQGVYYAQMLAAQDEDSAF